MLNSISICRDVEKSGVGRQRRIKRKRRKKEKNEENQKKERTRERKSTEQKKIICFKICTANRISTITAFHTRKPTTRTIKKNTKCEQIGNDLLKYARSEIGNTNTLCRKAHSMGRKNVWEMRVLLVWFVWRVLFIHLFFDKVN